MNKIKIESEITYIYLQNVDVWAKIDTEDLEKISICTWYGKNGKWDKYARGMIKGKEIKMHRLILGETNPLIHIDHINGDTYDNRKTNLRKVSNSENHMNQKTRKDSITKLKGVQKEGNHFIARIGAAGKIRIGSYQTKEEAAQAYDIEALKRYGKYAKLNFEEKREEYLSIIQEAPYYEIIK